MTNGKAPLPHLQAQPGDTLVLQPAGPAGLPRRGEILAVHGPHGTPPYLVRWLAGDYDSVITPGPTAHILPRDAAAAAEGHAS